MIDILCERGELAVVASSNNLIGYCFIGKLHEAFALLDDLLVKVLSRSNPMLPHSCTPLTQRSVLERIGFFEKLPSIPFHVAPHQLPEQEHVCDQWLLSPSTCYHTFALLSGRKEQWPLQCFTAISTCHRFEPESGNPMRMASFSMREFIYIGNRESVERESEAAFQYAVKFLRHAGFDIDLEAASDIFYGEDSAATRKVQKARGIKIEALTKSPAGGRVSVASRNFHRDLFTSAFEIGDPAQQVKMHSACVAFGVERLLLSLLAATEGYDPLRLMEMLRSSAKHFESAGEPA
ncbi:hypothetical protein SAMN03159444_01906 [Pseudomonas sp. NFACC02]|uniref:hypothetical protein n=1 Tax=Pseudomonas sp. NFACC02 TaxID=1566250 RepID=UPI0008AD4A3C|nr:hypothetical protein [Pseudomonas sp. NFACC02]SEQ54508.1 hypothetical protein SAMN03159444_01906 [Pseudomonas sp. NFACC02]